MAQGNFVEVIGNITRDPELRYTPSGQAIATFGIAVNRRWQNKQTQAWEEATSFFDVVAWGELGEHVVESCPKGTRALITGRLDQRTWETDSGDKRSKVEIVADDVCPSLRWATADVKRTERKDNSYDSTPRQAPAPAATPGVQSYSDYDPNSEPF